jgi:OOP family OmpA-OmpF porin
LNVFCGRVFSVVIFVCFFLDEFSSRHCFACYEGILMKNLYSAKFFFAWVALLGFSSAAVSDDGDLYSSGYLGARVGYSYNDNSCENTAIDCDKDEAGYGIFAGYDFNRRYALELSFNDVGDSVGKYPGVTVEGKLREIDLALKASYPLYKKTRIYGKLGAAWWDAEVTGGSVDLDDTGVRPLIGGGIEFPLSDHWTTRIEYQYIDQIGNSEMGRANANFFGLSLVWNFTSRAQKKPVAIVVAPEPQPIVKTPEPVADQRIIVDEQVGGPLFDFDKAVIRNTAAIDPVVKQLIQYPSLYVSITGHTDSRGATEYNQRLSETRANVVAKYLQSKGVVSNRITVHGMGEEQPIADNQTEEGRAKNRRVEFVISGAKTL